MGAIVGVGGGLGVLLELGEVIQIPGDARQSKLGTLGEVSFLGDGVVLPDELDKVPSGQVSRVGSLHIERSSGWGGNVVEVELIVLWGEESVLMHASTEFTDGDFELDASKAESLDTGERLPSRDEELADKVVGRRRPFPGGKNTVPTVDPFLSCLSLFRNGRACANNVGLLGGLQVSGSPLDSESCGLDREDIFLGELKKVSGDVSPPSKDFELDIFGTFVLLESIPGTADFGRDPFVGEDAFGR